MTHQFTIQNQNKHISDQYLTKNTNLMDNTAFEKQKRCNFTYGETKHGTTISSISQNSNHSLKQSQTQKQYIEVVHCILCAKDYKRQQFQFHLNLHRNREAFIKNDNQNKMIQVEKKQSNSQNLKYQTLSISSQKILQQNSLQYSRNSQSHSSFQYYQPQSHDTLRYFDLKQQTLLLSRINHQDEISKSFFQKQVILKKIPQDQKTLYVNQFDIKKCQDLGNQIYQNNGENESKEEKKMKSGSLRLFDENSSDQEFKSQKETADGKDLHPIKTLCLNHSKWSQESSKNKTNKTKIPVNYLARQQFIQKNQFLNSQS